MDIQANASWLHIHRRTQHNCRKEQPAPVDPVAQPAKQERRWSPNSKEGGRYKTSQQPVSLLIIEAKVFSNCSQIGRQQILVGIQQCSRCCEERSHVDFLLG